MTQEVNKFLENPKIEVKGLQYSTTSVHSVGGEDYRRLGADIRARECEYSVLIQYFEHEK